MGLNGHLLVVSPTPRIDRSVEGQAERSAEPYHRGSDRLTIDADGWTLRSADGSNTAHSEHTIAITETGPRILTPMRCVDAVNRPGA